LSQSAATQVIIVIQRNTGKKSPPEYGIRKNTESIRKECSPSAGTLRPLTPPLENFGNVMKYHRKQNKNGKKLKRESITERIPGKNGCDDKPEKTYETGNNNDYISCIFIHL
jgi:hypothetical protein